MPKYVDRLEVPSVELAIGDAGAGRLNVELDVPRSGPPPEQVPFLEVTRNEQAALLNGARQDLLARLGRSDFAIGDVRYRIDAPQSPHDERASSANSPRFGKVAFEIASETRIRGGVDATLRDQPALSGAIREAERNFDARRRDLYESSAREWFRGGGATLESDGERYIVSREAAKRFVDRRDSLDRPERTGTERIVGERESVIARATPMLAAGDEALNRQFAQALRGASGDRDVAAVAVAALREAPGYKPEQDIRVAQGKNGWVVSQGEGDAALNVRVPPAQPGDFERVSQRLAQATPQVDAAPLAEPTPRARNV
ncbi:MAG: hypothetical protein E6Q50_01965 [Lysobacter sp.]|nr:MAG: hypothetical protein E6Q50_01965 [Lysobacter sp.]